MFKKLLALTMVFAIAFGLAACEQTTGLTDVQKLDEAAEDLSIATEVSGDIELPATGLHGVTVTWVSANEAVIANDGTVTQPAKTAGDVEVALTATLTLGDEEYEIPFTVTVLAATDLNDAEKLNEAVVDLTVPSAAGSDLTLPAEGLHEVAIAWASSHEMYIMPDGTVMKPALEMGDVVVTLTATFTIGAETYEKDYEVTVTAGDEYSDEYLVNDALQVVLLTVSGNVEMDFELAAQAKGYDITWTSANDDLLMIEGTTAKVTRPESGVGNQDVVITASITIGEVTNTKDFTVSIKEKDPSLTYASIADLHAASQLDDVIEFVGIVTGVFDGGYFLSDGTHSLGIYAGNNDLSPMIGDEVKVIGSYAVYNTLYQLGSVQYEEILSTGNANPLEGTAMVKTVAEMLALDTSDPLMHGMYYEVTGTIELRGSYNNIYLVEGDDALLIYYYSLEDSLAALEAEVGKKVTITVFYYTEHGTNGHMVAFDGGAEDIEVNTLSDIQALTADLTALESEIPAIAIDDIVLPTMGVNGTMFTNWASSNTDIFANDGTFVARGAATETVTFTATATKGSESLTAVVTVVVPTLSTVAEVLDMNNGDVFEVTAVVYEMSYYGFFLEQGGDFIFVYYKQYDGPMMIGDEITILGERGEYSGLAQINLLSDIAINSSGNALPSALPTTVEAAEFDLIPRGTIATVTGTVSIEGTYDDVFLNGAAGGKIKVYYRSNADELAGFVGQIITVNIVTYHDGTVLYQGLAADAVVETDFTDATKAEAAVAALDLGDTGFVLEDLVLPADEALTGATFLWETSDAAVVTAAGEITPVPGEEVYATLTVTATVGAETATRDFMITIPDPDGQPPLSVSDALLEADGESVLVVGVIIGKYYDERVIQGPDGAAIWVDSSIGGEIGDEVKVRGTLSTYTSYGNNHRQLDSATLLETLSTGNALVMSDETDVATIFGELGSMEVYTATLTVTAVNDGYGYALFNTVDVEGTEEEGFKFKIEDFAPYFEDVYMVGDMIEMTFTAFDYSFNNIRMVNVTLPALTDAQALAAAMGYVDIGATVSSDLTLPTEMYGVTISWASDNAAITDMGVVTRPANGDGDATVNLTATYTINAETDTEVFVVTVPEEAPPAMTIFISEYIEGGSNNKAIELYNPNDFAVTLTGYTLVRNNNGGTDSPDITDLSHVTIEAGDVYVIYNSSAVADIINVGDESGTVTYFNGDDCIELKLDGVVVDIIGVLGEDPGSAWTVGTGSTQNYTLVRDPSITTGNTTFTAAEWIVHPQDTFTDLGSHTVN